MVAVNASFFSDMLQSIADRSRALIRRERREPARGRLDGLIELCEALLSGRGEASGVALASEILADYAALTTGRALRFSSRWHAPSATILRALTLPSPPGGNRNLPMTRPNCIAPANRAGSSFFAGSISHPAAPPPWCTCATS